jgi:two-component system, chemotaxis family, CheB/CheR fusion protein
MPVARHAGVALKAVPTEDSDPEFDELLLMLKETRGFDFTGYKRTTLKRRIRRRMDARSLTTLDEYRDYLELEPEEFGRLFDSLLINVTGFFRDPPAWRALREEVLPQLLPARSTGRPLRAWSAGCASGEEAYTLAIVLAEAMGLEDFVSRVKIYATDLDEDALAEARAGVYTERQVAEVDEELRRKYFEASGTKYAFRRDLRRQVIYGRNDLTCDAPISRVDLLVARNTLMYFNAETQSNIVRKFHFALADPGFLFLGKAEMLPDHGEQFEPVDLRKRLFRKIGKPVPVEPSQPATVASAGSGEPAAAGLESAALAAGPVAQLVIDRSGRLVAANIRAQTLFNLLPRDVGRPFQDLEVSYRPVELRSVIEHVTAEQRPVELTDVTWQRTPVGDPGVYDVNVVPLYRFPEEPAGVGISFLDVSKYRQLRDQLERSNHDLERAYEELQALNEELETTNEELQALNEELETTNEELHSTNDELEAMNVELQSTNDELRTTNDVLRSRSEELGSAKAFVSSALRSLGSAAVVVDTDLRVTMWAPGADDLWGLRPDEATGRLFAELDIGLPAEDLVPVLKRTLTGRPARTQAVVEAMNRRGRPVSMLIECLLLRDDDGKPQGVLMAMNEAGRQQ